MTKQVINGNYPSDLINVGSASNSHNGDTLRSAFIKINDALDKVDANFTELYTATGADVQIPAQTGYDGKFLTTNGTTLSWASASGDLVFSGNSLYNPIGPVDIWSGPANGPYHGEIYLDEHGVGLFTNNERNNWLFDNSGTINTPLLLPLSFTAVLDSAHMANAIGLTDTPWELHVQFQVNPNGTVQTMIDNIFPIITNPGYVSGQVFQFTEADHGITGYTFTVTLNDVVLPGGAGWTANIAVSQPPVYPSTIASGGAIKLSSASKDFVFGTDGKITLPLGGDIVDSNGTSLLNVSQTQIINGTSSVSVPSVNGDAVISINQTADFRFSADNGLQVPEIELPTNAVIKQNYSFTRTTNLQIPASVANVIWTALVPYISGVKLTIQVESNQAADNTGWHVQTCEAIIASRGYASGITGYGEPVMTVYGITYTSNEPLMTFSVRRNSINNLIEIVGTPTAVATSNPSLRIYSVEMATTD